MANDVRGELARRIAEVAPGDLDKVFFTNGGADANEYAVRMARAVTGRRKVLSMYRSYHGNTATAISLTGDPRRWANEPADGSVAHFFGPYAYRSSFHSSTARAGVRSARSRTSSRPSCSRAPRTIAAIIIETIVGTNGVLVPPPGYLAGRPRAVRQVRHRLHRRRGHGRLRPRRRVVRGQRASTSCPTSSPSRRA